MKRFIQALFTFVVLACATVSYAGITRFVLPDSIVTVENWAETKDDSIMYIPQIRMPNRDYWETYRDLEWSETLAGEGGLVMIVHGNKAGTAAGIHLIADTNHYHVPARLLNLVWTDDDLITTSGPILCRIKADIDETNITPQLLVIEMTDTRGYGLHVSNSHTDGQNGLGVGSSHDIALIYSQFTNQSNQKGFNMYAEGGTNVFAGDGNVKIATDTLLVQGDVFRVDSLATDVEFRETQLKISRVGSAWDDHAIEIENRGTAGTGMRIRNFQNNANQTALMITGKGSADYALYIQNGIGYFGMASSQFTGEVDFDNGIEINGTTWRGTSAVPDNDPGVDSVLVTVTGLLATDFIFLEEYSADGGVSDVPEVGVYVAWQEAGSFVVKPINNTNITAEIKFKWWRFKQ